MTQCEHTKQRFVMHNETSSVHLSLGHIHI